MRSRGQYEQYFLGMEKRPPLKAHDQFRKRLAELRTVPSRNSALSFRIQSLQASAATYERLWSQDAAGDGGRHVPPRHLQGARRRKSSAPELPAAPPPVLRRRRAEAGCHREGRGRAQPATPQPPALRRSRIFISPGRLRPDPLAETRLRSVYRAYVEAKRRCNEDTTRLSFDAVVASLKRQVPELLERHNARDVEYRVFVKDGKAILRAVPKCEHPSVE